MDVVAIRAVPNEVSDEDLMIGVLRGFKLMDNPEGFFARMRSVEHPTDPGIVGGNHRLLTAFASISLPERMIQGFDPPSPAGFWFVVGAIKVIDVPAKQFSDVLPKLPERLDLVLGIELIRDRLVGKLRIGFLELSDIDILVSG